MIVVFNLNLKICLISAILGKVLRVLLLLLVYDGATCAILHRAVMFLLIILEHDRFVLGLLGRRIAQTLLSSVSALGRGGLGSVNHGRTIVGVTSIVLHAFQTLEGRAHLSTGWRGPFRLILVSNLVLR